jgi:transcriptional regulator with XRE-family HTH domain
MKQSKVRKAQSRCGQRGPDPMDARVGSRVRLRRNMLGLSQAEVAKFLGITFQQVQKYERGANRMGASRLIEMAKILDVPVEFFFDDTDPVRAPAVPVGATSPITSAFDPMSCPLTIELVSLYYGIAQRVVRRRLFELAKALAEESFE